MSDSVMRIGTDYDNRRVDQFLELFRKDEVRDVLELGTLQWEPPRYTHHKEWKPEANWTLSDFMPGIDVDVVADAHELTDTFDPETFDAVIAVSVWEHLQRPWIAAGEVAALLRPGGVIYIATHQTFPIHGYPDDYFRFSDRALSLIFEDAGLRVIDAGYAFKLQIIPPPVVTRWNPHAENWLNVDLVAVRDR